MQVNNNPSTQNFGMALKITKGSENFLKRESVETLNKLNKIGEEMKDYKYWDLKITEHGPIAESRDWVRHASLTGNIAISRKPDNNLELVATYADSALKGKQAVVTIPNESPSCAQVEVSNFKTSNLLDKFVEAVKLLEFKSAKEAELRQKEAARMTEINAKVDGLMSKFGVDA